MSKQPSMSRLVRWLAGIAATVLSFYLVWYFTQPKPPTPPSAPPSVATLEGMVHSGSAPVPNAMVVVELTGVASANRPVYDITDGNGAYRFDFTGLPEGARVALVVRAMGYEIVGPRSIIGPLEVDNRVDFAMPPVPGSGAGSASPSAGERTGKIPAYLAKSAADAVHVKIVPIAPVKQ